MQENIQGVPADPSVGGAPVDASQISPTAGNVPIAGPPMSPGEAPMADPSMMGGQPQVSPEEKAKMQFELEGMFDKIKTKKDAFEEKQALNSEKLEGLKAKIVREIFSLMKDMGVDPSDLNSINEFLQKLQQQDPDLYTLFESAIGSLSPEEAPGMEEGMSQGMPSGMEEEIQPRMGEGPGGGEGPIPGGGPRIGEGPGMGRGPEMPPPGTGASEEGGGLMEENTTNLQENILRQ